MKMDYETNEVPTCAGAINGSNIYTNVNFNVASKHVTDDGAWAENSNPHGFQYQNLKKAALVFVVAIHGTPAANAYTPAPTNSNYMELASNTFIQPVHLHHDNDRDDLSAVTAQEMINSVKDFFGLNMAQAARVFGVSRATIYNHSRSAEASVQNYQELYDLVLRLKPQNYYGVGKKLKSAAVEGKTLLEILTTKPTNETAISEACKSISDMQAHNLPKHNVDEVRSAISGIVKS